MKPWTQRPVEIRNLFNPAFCGLVLARSLTGYAEEDPRGMPFSLALLVLPLCLHKESREILSRGSRSYFLKIVSTYPQLRINLAGRCTDLLPFTFEALGLLMQMQALGTTGEGRLVARSDGIKKSVSGTPESMSCQRVARFLGREFARISDRVTVYSTLGVRP